MDHDWLEQQRAFQARVLTDDAPSLALRPYRTFVGPATVAIDHRAGRAERLLVIVVAGGVIASLVLAFGLPREVAALAAGLTGGIATIIGLSPTTPHDTGRSWTPLLAVYSPTVVRGAPPACITEISADEFQRLGTEGFGTVVGNPRPGATFGLFVDDHLVWPRTPPRPPQAGDPGFGTA